MTYIWCCELSLDPQQPFSPVSQMVALLLCKCGTLNCGFTCKLILVVASTADSHACRVRICIMHMYA